MNEKTIIKESIPLAKDDIITFRAQQIMDEKQEVLEKMIQEATDINNENAELKTEFKSVEASFRQAAKHHSIKKMLKWLKKTGHTTTLAHLTKKVESLGDNAIGTGNFTDGRTRISFNYTYRSELPTENTEDCIETVSRHTTYTLGEYIYASSSDIASELVSRGCNLIKRTDNLQKRLQEIGDKSNIIRNASLADVKAQVRQKLNKKLIEQHSSREGILSLIGDINFESNQQESGEDD